MPDRHQELDSIAPNDHHPQSHAHDGSDGSGSVSHDNLTGVSADDHHPQSHTVDSHSDATITNPTLAGQVQAPVDLGNNALTNVGAAGHNWTFNGLIQTGTSKAFTARDATNTGIQYVGSGGSSVSVAPGEAFTFKLATGCLFLVQNISEAKVGVFAASNNSATVHTVSDHEAAFDTTDVDNNKIAVFKAAASDFVNIKNYEVATRNIGVVILGHCGGATAPA